MLCQGKRPRVTSWSDAFACQCRASPLWAGFGGAGGGLVALKVEGGVFAQTLDYRQHRCAFPTSGLVAPHGGCCASHRLAFLLSIFHSLFLTPPRLPLIRPTLEINKAIIAHLHLRFPSSSSAPNPRLHPCLCVRPCAGVFGLYGELVGLFFFLSPTPPPPPHAGCPPLI